MALRATFVLAWAALHAYACVYFLGLYLRRRVDREYLAFGLLSFGFATFCAGRVLEAVGTSMATRQLGVSVEAVGLAVSLPTLVELTGELVGRRLPRLLRLGYVWAALVIAGVGLRVLGRVDADGHLDSVTIGVLVLGFGTSVGAACVLLAGPRRAMTDGRVYRVLAVVLATEVLAGLHDLFVRGGLLDTPLILDLVLVSHVLAMGGVLVRRSVRSRAELRARTDELEASTSALRQSQARLVRREQLAAVGELSAVIAHEVRNPLAVIKNAVSGLRRRRLPDEDRRMLLGILDEETAKLHRLTHDLLAYARPAAPKGRPVLVAQLLERAFERARDAMGADAADAELKLEVAGVDTVHGDPELLRNALINLFENALHAQRGRGEVDASAREKLIEGRSFVELSVRDRGPGMDEATRAKAMDPFFTTRPTGTGLGLAIVDRVVRDHGGELVIESRENEGTTVTFHLPREADAELPRSSATGWSRRPAGEAR